MRIENGLGWVEEDGKLVSATPAQYVADITQLCGNLSLAEEGLANYQQEVERLQGEILKARRNGSVPEAFWLQVPQSASIDSVSGNDYSTVHGEDESGTDPCAAREAREAGPKEV